MTRAGFWLGGCLTTQVFRSELTSHLLDGTKCPKSEERVESDQREMVLVNELRQRLPAAERRSQLLEVALQRFAAKGYHETSMEEIADAAGVTKPVLYQHFGSKSTLYFELLDTVGQELLHSVNSSVSAEEHPRQQILSGFHTYFRFVRERTSAFQLLFGGGARESEEFAEAVHRLEAEMATTIAGFIEADIDAEHREVLAYAIVGLAEVTGRLWVTRNPAGAALDPAEGETLAVRLADLVFAGLRGLPGNDRH